MNIGGTHSAYSRIPYRILTKYIIGQMVICTLEKNKVRSEESVAGIAVCLRWLG